MPALSDTPQLPPPPKNWWQRLNSPATEPPSKAWYRNWFIVCLVVLALIFWTRESGSRESLFGITALFGLLAGGFLGGWFREHY